jgi:hypothetical protein
LNTLHCKKKTKSIIKTAIILESLGNPARDLFYAALQQQAQHHTTESGSGRDLPCVVVRSARTFWGIAQEEMEKGQKKKK